MSTENSADGCEFCLSPKPMGDSICGEVLAAGQMLTASFTCTRPPNHDGKHVACGGHHDLVRWSSEVSEQSR